MYDLGAYKTYYGTYIHKIETTYLLYVFINMFCIFYRYR